MAEIIPRPLDKAVESLNSKFAVVSGDLPNSASSNIVIALPTGFTSSNCIIVGSGSRPGNYTHNIASMEDKQDINLTINPSNQVQVTCGANYQYSNFGGKTIYVLLFKIS